MMKSLSITALGVLLLWLFQPTYSQLDHWFLWIPQLIVIIVGVGMIVAGVIGVVSSLVALLPR